jgi:hypothetical protein
VFPLYPVAEPLPVRFEGPLVPGRRVPNGLPPFGRPIPGRSLKDLPLDAGSRVMVIPKDGVSGMSGDEEGKGWLLGARLSKDSRANGRGVSDLPAGDFGPNILGLDGAGRVEGLAVLGGREVFGRSLATRAFGGRLLVERELFGRSLTGLFDEGRSLKVLPFLGRPAEGRLVVKLLPAVAEVLVESGRSPAAGRITGDRAGFVGHSLSIGRLTGFVRSFGPDRPTPVPRLDLWRSGGTETGGAVILDGVRIPRAALCSAKISSGFSSRTSPGSTSSTSGP